MLFGKHINKYYLKYFALFFLGIVFLIFVDWIQTYMPEQLGAMVNQMTAWDEYGDNSAIIESVTFLGINVIIIGGMMFVGRFGWRIFLMSASTRIEKDIRLEMFQKAERLGQSFYHEQKIGDILNYFTSDLDEVVDFLRWGTVQLVDAIGLGGMVLIKMFRLNVALSLVCLIPIVLIAIWALFAEKLFTEKWKLRQSLNDKIYSYAQESFTGIRVIKAFVKEAQQIREFEKIAKANKDTDIKVSRFFIVFERIIDLFLYFVFGGIYAIGILMVFKAAEGDPLFGISLDVGELVTFIGLFETVIWPVMALGMIVSMLARAKASLGRISNFLDAPEDLKDAEDAKPLNNVKGKIEVKNLTFRFPTRDYDRLHEVSFTIEAGETVGIIGRVGCGKSTLVNLLTRMYNVPEGTILIDGQDIMKSTLHSLHECIAYCPQDNFLFSDTIEANVEMGKAGSTLDDVRVATRFSDVDKDIMDFTDQYKTKVGERGTTLSGGQKQRISMARAYVKDAPIMIMDDSVSAVDVKTEENILRHIKEDRAGKTTLIVASRVSTVSHLDKVIVLNSGCLEAFGSPKELLTSSKTYAKMHMLQQLEKEEETKEAASNP